MKHSLEKHISEILAALQISTPFAVYKCNEDILPEWTIHIPLTHEFLICCDGCSERKKLEKFTGKKINGYNNYSYWFEGDKLLTEKKDEIVYADEKTSVKVDYLKTDTRLPFILDDFIYKRLNAEYAPDFQRFEHNLDLTKEDNLKYLGTYFPRSYSESFCIFDNVFQNKNYQKAFSENKSLNILSIGCGSGGDVIGLVTAIEKYFPQITELNIWAFDGNVDALSIFEKIIRKINDQSLKIITLKTINSTINSIREIDIPNISYQKFDFILSFKFICEIIVYGKGKLDNSYYDFVQKFVPMLSDNGLCVVLNVTTKSEHTTYNPILMNRQVNQALRELTQYKTLLPVPCGLYYNECYTDCFYQKTFSVTHAKHTNDKSKVAYKVIGNTSFVELIENKDISSKLLIDNDKCCPFTENFQKSEDAFLLKNNQVELNKGKVNSPLTISGPLMNQPDLLTIVPEQKNKEAPELFKLGHPKVAITVVGKIDLRKFEKPKKGIRTDKADIYIIDTNVFIEYPDIISRIRYSDYIILSAKVIDELDSLKSTLQNGEKRKVQKALKAINDSIGKRLIKMETADLKLLPEDFSKRSADNFILSVTLKYKDQNPILLTSDNGLQVKAKGLNIITMTLKEFLNQNNYSKI